MRLIFSLLLCLLLTSSSLFATQVTHEDARKLADHFLSGHGKATIAHLQAQALVNEDGVTTIYSFPVDPVGFILVSADDQSYPVIAYSFESNFSNENQPANFKNWLQGCILQISHARSQGIASDVKTREAWQTLLSGPLPSSRHATTSVDPLLTTTWDQGSPYNYLCPADPGGSGGHVYAGCVATAMAQVANYWRWPLQGQGTHGYYSAYGYLSADYGNTQYKWEEMANSAMGRRNFQMAQIQYHMGIAVDMMYGPNGSGAYSDDAAEALRNHFGMDQALHLEYAPSPIDETWKSMLRTELDAGRPMYYHGFGTGGHAFNVDGYQGTDYFHFNWGWSGSFNGYFYLENLNPGGNSFTEGQGAIIGIEPTGNYPYYCSSTDTLRALYGTIEDGSGPVESYLDNSNCGWLIIPEDSIVSITLTFHRFELEAADFLTIYDGVDTTAAVLGILTGTDAPQQVVSTGGTMFIKFTSNATNHQGGWFASYTANQAIFCSGLTTLTAPSGSIDDGSGTFNYHENSLCKYKIMPDSAHSITLTFDQFDTFDENDFMMIFNLENNDLLYTLWGSQNPGPLYFNTSKLLLMFRSNNADNAQGWSIRYSSSPYTSVEEKSAAVLPEIYPVPANETVIIRMQGTLTSPMKAELIAMNGSRVHEMQLPESENQMDVSGLPSGIYMLRISGDKFTWQRKLIIKH